MSPRAPAIAGLRSRGAAGLLEPKSELSALAWYQSCTGNARMHPISEAARGLTDEAARERLARDGANEVPAQPRHLLVPLAAQVLEPLGVDAGADRRALVDSAQVSTRA